MDFDSWRWQHSDTIQLSTQHSYEKGMLIQVDGVMRKIKAVHDDFNAVTLEPIHRFTLQEPHPLNRKQRRAQRVRTR